MNCRQAENWMDTVLDGVQPDRAPDASALPAGLDAHLRDCAPCREQWELLYRADTALRAPRPVSAPAGLLADFRNRLEAEARTRAVRAPRPWSMPWLWPAGSLAAAGLAAAVMIAFRPLIEPVPMAHAPTAESATEAMRGAPTADDAAVDAPKPGGPEVMFGASGARQVGAGGEPANSLDGGSKVAIRPKVSNPTTQATAHGSSGLAELPALKPAETGQGVSAYGERLTQGGARGIRLESKSNRGKSVMARRGDKPEYPGDNTVLRLYAKEEALEASPGAAGAVADAASRPGNGQTVFYLAVRPISGEPGAVEREVSPALLTALQRPVSLDLGDQTVRQVVQTLSAEADVLVRLESPAGTADRLTPRQTEPFNLAERQARANGEMGPQTAPLWVVLQSVAQQSDLQIIPEDNHLILRSNRRMSRAQVEQNALLSRQRGATSKGAPVRRRSEPKPKLPPTFRNTQASAAALAPARNPLGRAVEPAAPAPPGAAVLALGIALPASAVPAPDRNVWSAKWGLLPQRGFAIPEDLPDLPAPPAAVKKQR